MPHPRDLSADAVRYDLPDDRIARHPPADRGASRLLVHRNGAIEDRMFSELPDLLPAGALLVMNDTRVVKARLLFRKGTGAAIELFCLAPADGGPVEQAFQRRGEAAWLCAVGNARRWKQGPLALDHAAPDGGVRLIAERLPPAPEGARIAFSWRPSGLTFAEVLARVGAVPLPPYMHRSAEAADGERYQTVYAREEGSVAAPTAGLHFTPGLMERLKARGVEQARVTLHVGAGTFRPVHAPTMAGHAMHEERIAVPRATVAAVRDALGERTVVAIGTTTLRTLESLYWHGVALVEGRAGDELRVEQWEPYDRPAPPPPPHVALGAVLERMDRHGLTHVTGGTRLLIAPGYRVRTTDVLITNFHQPGSTLLLLVAACVGDDWRRIYAHALTAGYRFLSYGDATLLHVRRT